MKKQRVDIPNNLPMLSCKTIKIREDGCITVLVLALGVILGAVIEYST